jgi:NAD(P)-dependent dehydrogenase (short-subunit alcohol dehydrogenase family)
MPAQTLRIDTCRMNMPTDTARLLLETPGQPPGRSVAIVTGAAGAMGAAIVERLARAGLAVVLVDREGERACEVARATQAGGLVIEADLARPAAGEEIVGLVRRHLGRLDHVVNNAGLNLPQTIHEQGVAEWDAVMAVNLRAPMLLCRAAIPLWRAAGGGSVVNIGSRVWLSGAIPAYTASKAGIIGLTRSLAVELGPLNVRANTVVPSYVDTPFTRMQRPASDIAQRQARVLAMTPLGRIGTAQDIANAVAFLVSDQASFITGEALHVCGGAQLAARVALAPAELG